MTILDRANAFIGHEEEVDEGLETTMRRNAFIAGYKEALGVVKKMREAQKIMGRVMAESDDYSEVLIHIRKAEKLESEVDELIKEMEL